jgi:hypothetical protein
MAKAAQTDVSVALPRITPALRMGEIGGAPPAQPDYCNNWSPVTVARAGNVDEVAQVKLCRQ